MIRQSGLVISARPIASICCSPPDSVLARWLRRSRRRGNSCVDALEIPAVTVGVALGDQQVLLDAERRKDAAALRHQAHAAAHGLERRLLRDVVALEHDLAAARRIEADDRIHQRGLADAVPAEQAEDLALLELAATAPAGRKRPRNKCGCPGLRESPGA